MIKSNTVILLKLIALLSATANCVNFKSTNLIGSHQVPSVEQNPYQGVDDGGNKFHIIERKTGATVFKNTCYEEYSSFSLKDNFDKIYWPFTLQVNSDNQIYISIEDCARIKYLGVIEEGLAFKILDKTTKKIVFQSTCLYSYKFDINDNWQNIYWAKYPAQSSFNFSHDAAKCPLPSLIDYPYQGNIENEKLFNIIDRKTGKKIYVNLCASDFNFSFSANEDFIYWPTGSPSIIYTGFDPVYCATIPEGHTDLKKYPYEGILDGGNKFHIIDRKNGQTVFISTCNTKYPNFNLKSGIYWSKGYPNGDKTLRYSNSDCPQKIKQ